MELLEAIANDPAFHVEMDFRPGEVQLLNNARILHAPEAYEDHDDPLRVVTCCDCGSLHIGSPASSRNCAKASARPVDANPDTIGQQPLSVDAHAQASEAGR